MLKLLAKSYATFLFCLCDHDGSLTRAANQLHISQPAFSYANAQFESDLQVKLFDRKAND
ncbi:helix-turn-helix domain-containing protein [Ileibacterium valens]|uniref:helix-turn-helix domain-containing protein n=1 Tax=Ileibacterium valens TaxID=1862668 RepID=UPI00272AD57F|nr:LysR family transcriptional regulator [Ileibacterium valens]